MTIPDEAFHAAIKVLYYANPHDVTSAITAALPFLTGVKVLDDATMQKLRAALRFSASRSVMSSADEDRILSAIEISAPDMGNPITLVYTNYRGETSERTITPIKPWFGSTEWHPEPQWLLTAFDHEKQANRDFALKDFGYPAPSPRAQALEALKLTPAIEAITPTTDEWLRCETVQDTYDLMKRRIAAAIRALSSQTVSDGWLPIETAPKDGTVVLCADSGPLPYVAEWKASIKSWVGSDGYCWTPTHWRPLPASPGASE